MSRAALVSPLYAQGGPITIELREDGDVYRRGDCELVSPKPGDAWLMEYVSCLVRWEDWLHRARLGTLRWLAEQKEVSLAAGRITASAAVRSQLLRAKLLRRSDFWGEATADDCRPLSFWARCELDRRGK